MCYNHMFIYAEFEIIDMFLKKDAQHISLLVRNMFYIHVYTQSSVGPGHLG